VKSPPELVRVAASLQFIAERFARVRALRANGCGKRQRRDGDRGPIAAAPETPARLRG